MRLISLTESVGVLPCNKANSMHRLTKAVSSPRYGKRFFQALYRGIGRTMLILFTVQFQLRHESPVFAISAGFLF